MKWKGKLQKSWMAVRFGRLPVLRKYSLAKRNSAFSKRGICTCRISRFWPTWLQFKTSLMGSKTSSDDSDSEAGHLIIEMNFIVFFFQRQTKQLRFWQISDLGFDSLFETLEDTIWQPCTFQWVKGFLAKYYSKILCFYVWVFNVLAWSIGQEWPG